MRATDPAKLSHAVALHQSGQVLEKAASGADVSSSVLLRELNRLGLTRSKRIELPNVVEDYTSGESALALSQRHGVSRPVIDRILREADVQPRGASEANVLHMARLSHAERQERCLAANQALRGQPARESRLEMAAVTRQRRYEPQSGGEVSMIGWLKELGETPRTQVAVGRYNVDLTVADVAVEVLGGEWHGSKRHHESRTKAILDGGWHVIFVWDTARYPITRKAAKHVVAFTEFARADPSSVREYRVIRGDGYLVATGRADNYNLTLIPPARDRVG